MEYDVSGFAALANFIVSHRRRSMHDYSPIQEAEYGSNQGDTRVS